MAAVFASPIDTAFFASPEAADAEAAVALLAAAALLADLVRSACSLLTCPCRSSIRASRGLRSVQPAAIASKPKMAAFAFIFIAAVWRTLKSPYNTAQIVEAAMRPKLEVNKHLLNNNIYNITNVV